MTPRTRRLARRYSFRIIQDGMTVVSASGTDQRQLKAEAAHYAMMYAQDGPVQVKFSSRRSTRKVKP